MRAHMKRRLMIGVMLLALGMGCTRGPEGSSLQLELVQTVGRKISGVAGAPPTARPALTRAALDGIPGAYIEVVLETRDSLAYLSQQLVRRDGLPGQIEVWRSEDNITLTLRSGVLIATRGLGDDLLSASALVGGGPGPVSGGERRYQIRGLDNRAQALVMACSLQDLGGEVVEIVERRHHSRHLQERCEGAGGLVINDYWVDAGSGRVWKSRQWAGPTLGYVRIRQLTT